jgi:hypothetical protein
LNAKITERGKWMTTFFALILLWLIVVGLSSLVKFSK